jgi:hypothetical protein
MTMLEARIAEIMKSGRRPVIELFPGMQVIPPKQPRRGRPRVRQPGHPHAHYRDDRVKGNRAICPPRCLMRGCGKRLRRDQRGACCEIHADWVVNDALLRLHAVDVTGANLREWYTD